MKTKKIKFKNSRTNLLVDARGHPVKQFSDTYGYRSAEEDRLNAGFTIKLFSPSSLISLAARKIRARAQDLERDSDYVRRFLRLMEDNIIGWRGIRLQSEATRSEQTDTPDRQAIRLIEDRWQDWSESDDVTCDHMLDMVDLQKMLVRRRIVDGEAFVEFMPGFDNDYRFAIRIHDADDVPLGYNDPDKRIFFGIKYDEFWRPVSYFVSQRKNNAMHGFYVDPSNLMEIPAERIRHYYVPERPYQRRGISALCSTAERMYMLGKYEQATLVGAQIAAAKMGFFRDPDGESLEPLSPTDIQGSGDQEQLIIDVEAGNFQDIGHKLFDSFDPDYPPTRYEEYTKSLIREAASGMGISYHLLANDLSSVNYSTARESKLQDVEYFRAEQHRLIRKIMNHIADAWIRVQLLTPEFRRYSSGDYNRLKQRRWQARGWDWIDPEKEAKANRLQLEMGVKSPSMVCADKGLDFEEVLEQISRDRDLCEMHGVDFERIVYGGQNKTPEPDQQENVEDEKDT